MLLRRFATIPVLLRAPVLRLQISFKQCALRQERRHALLLRQHQHVMTVVRATSTDANTVDTTTEPEQQTTKSIFGKRKVAIHLGYEGTGYKGLQKQPLTAPTDTIEHIVERAIFQAGGILESNYGSLSRLGWSRSSRTDKSVHSLATIICMKLECDPDSFDTDPQGSEIADSINEHLPPSIRVFSVQRVTGSFNARSECLRRTYHYYLPMSVLCGGGEGSVSVEEEQEAIERLTAAWSCFEGHQPFHNYTRRSKYRAPDKGGESSRRQKKKGNKGRDRRGEEGGSSAVVEAGVQEQEVGDGGSSGTTANPTTTTQNRPLDDRDRRQQRNTTSSFSSTDSIDEDDDEEEDFSLEQQTTLDSSDGNNNNYNNGDDDDVFIATIANDIGGYNINLQWKSEKDEADIVGRRHFRFIEQCTVSTTPIHLLPDDKNSERCIRLSVKGASFMLHQIRHMVGAAVTVARQRVPLSLIPVSLTTPARLSFPLAPACSLMLVSADFSAFRISFDGKPAMISKYSGEQLELRGTGITKQQEFSENRLFPALNELLKGEEWRQWSSSIEKLTVDEKEVERMVGYTEDWQRGKTERREKRERAIANDSGGLML